MIDHKHLITERYSELANEFNNLTEDDPQGYGLLARMAELDDLMDIFEAAEAAQRARDLVQGARKPRLRIVEEER